MILTDTSVWVDHLRAGDAAVARLLNDENLLIHPFVIGEIALGHLNPRQTILARLSKLPAAIPAMDEDVMTLIESHELYGTGVGFIDAHLLASVRLTAGAWFWTRDKRLQNIARRMGIAADME